MSENDLDSRPGLPDSLRVLLAEYPREAWRTDPGFSGLVKFWLDRHMSFRELHAALTSETDARLDAGGDADRHRAIVSRYGGMLVNGLHGHHHIEDAHYFPLLAEKDARILGAFELLDADHHRLDRALHDFTVAANALITADGTGPDAKTPVAAFRDELAGLGRLLDRHLTDEEDVVVPVILRYGDAALG
ncbi:hemerythrin domain-containing protein [Rhodobacterales bacterium HKCCE2091]|nr:hemerythrin domain-containing protein [Rhodobacterales bacterium HKCCE2091]